VFSLTVLGNITQNIAVFRLSPRQTVAFTSGIRIAINKKEGVVFNQDSQMLEESHEKKSIIL
jgi:hypothetical protein